MKHCRILLSFLLLAATLVVAQSAPPIETSQLGLPIFTVNITPATQANTALVGNPGPQTVYYWMVTNFTFGASSPTGPFAVTNAPNVLSGSNYISVTPVYPAGIASIDLLKTSTPTPPSGACNCAVASGVTSGSISDQSNSTSSYTVAPLNPAAFHLTITNEVQSPGVTHAILRQGGVFVADLSLTGGGTITGAAPGGGLVVTGTTLGLLKTCSTGQSLAWNGSVWACTSVFANPMTTLGDSIGGGASGAATRIAGPTSPNGVPQTWTSTPSGGAATLENWQAAGMLGRAITGTTSTDAIVSTDCTNPVQYTGSVAVGVSLPTPTTLGVANCVFLVVNSTTGSSTAVTVTPATWTCNGGSSCTVAQGQIVRFRVDPNLANNWKADIQEQNVSASSPIVVVRSATGISVTCPSCGTGSGNLSGTLMANSIPAASGPNSLVNSSITDDLTNPVGIGHGTDVSTSGGYDWQAPNNASTGTTLNKLACDDGFGKATLCLAATAATNVPLGVAVHGSGSAAPGTTGNTGICLIGFCTVLFDTSATANRYAQESSSTDGELADVGATAPTNGQPYYFIDVGNSGPGTTAVIRDLTGSELNATSTGGGGSRNTLLVNGTALGKGDKVNFNSTTPAAGGGTINLPINTSKSGNTDSVTVNPNVTGTGTTLVTSTSPALTTPNIGAATGTSLLVTGILDGQSPVTIVTSGTCTPAATYKSGYLFNQNATAATAVTCTLPTAAAGLQYCVANSYNGSAPTTGTLELLTSASGQFIIFTDGTLSATGGFVQSGGAAGDAACVVGLDATHWMLYVQRGTWTKH